MMHHFQLILIDLKMGRLVVTVDAGKAAKRLLVHKEKRSEPI